jgi:hypothetical protein
MARIIYGPVELQQVRIQNVDTEAVRDPSGTDVLYMKVTLDVLFEWHPFATASTNGVPLGAQLLNNGAPGNAIGMSIRDLKNVLNTDRQLFKLSIGPDVVFQAPENDSFGNVLPCDVGNGPITGKASVFNLSGEKSAQGRWKITFFVPLGGNILLSNRWTVEATTSDTGFTTRVINGAAIVRADAVGRPGDEGGIVNVDDMRKWLLCEVPFGFRRDKVRVLVDEKGANARYTVTDIQVANPLGFDGGFCGAVKITGTATAGSKSVFKTRIGQAAQVEKSVWGNISIFDSPGNFIDHVVQYIRGESVLNVQTASAMVRVTGGQNAPKTLLAQLGTRICLERFPNGRPISAECTQGVGDQENQGRWVEIRMLFLNNWRSAVSSTLNIYDFDSQMKLSNELNPFDPPGQVIPVNRPFPGGTATANPMYQSYNLQDGRRPGETSGSRGNWLGALLAAALQDVGSAPPVPPANATAMTSDLV